MAVFRAIVIVSFLSAAASDEAPPDKASQTGQLRVVVGPLASDDGAVMIYIHERPTFVKKNLSKRENGVCRAIAAADIVQRRAEWTTDPLPYGEYAIIVHHDVNGDGVVNFGTILPSEPIGYSNYDHAIAGYPEFDVARIVLDKPTRDINVEAYLQGRIFRRQLKE